MKMEECQAGSGWGARACSSWQAVVLLGCGCLAAATMFQQHFPSSIFSAAHVPRPRTIPWRLGILDKTTLSSSYVEKLNTSSHHIFRDKVIRSSSNAVMSWTSKGGQSQTHLKLSCKNSSTGDDLFSKPHEGSLSSAHWDSKCRNVCQRYASMAGDTPYYDLKSNQQGKMSDHVVLVTTHWRSHFTAELLVHLRSLVVESFPRPVFLLHHCESTETKLHDVSRLPSWLQPIAFPYATDELLEFLSDDVYGLVTVDGQVNLTAKDRPRIDVKFYTDLPVLLFMKHNPHFAFVWVLEDDVRLIGSWDTFFTGSFAAAEANLARRNLSGPPDLVTFETVCVATQQSWWWIKFVEGFDSTHWRHGLLVLRGYSRQLVDKVQQVYKQNYQAHFEQFSLTVAEMFKLNVAVVDHPRYGDQNAIAPHACKQGLLPSGGADLPWGGSYVFASDVALRLYNQWLEQNYCQRPVLLHPVKASQVVTERSDRDCASDSNVHTCFNWSELP